MIKRIFRQPLVRQFFSYFCVGGVAAIVEWLIFALFANVFLINYILSTCLAFVFSTSVNWFLGRIWTFRNSNSYKGKNGFEILSVFAVSAVGLLFNIGLMYLFVSVMGLDTPILRTISKIAATGIVFIWNFLARKLIIYKQ